jgi:hypothetical protein
MADGSFTFSVEQNKDGHIIYMDSKNTVREISEMLVLLLVYVAHYNEQLADDIVETYCDYMRGDHREDLLPFGALPATLQA